MRDTNKNWDRPVRNLDAALDSISAGCKTLQFEHRLDPGSDLTVFSYKHSDLDGHDANPHIGNDGAEAVAKALEKNTTCYALDLSGNQIKRRGVKAIAEMLKVNRTIKILYLEDNWIGDKGAKEIANMLYANDTLEELSLSGNRITNAGAKKIARALKRNTTLKELSMNKNQLRDGGAKKLARACRRKDGIDSLCLEGNKIREGGAKRIAKTLRNKNTDLETVNLAGNKIGSRGAKYFKKAIKKNKSKNLNVLMLDGNRMTDHDLTVLENLASSKGIDLQHRNAAPPPKGGMVDRSTAFIKYHLLKPRYAFQGHYDPEDRVDFL